METPILANPGDLEPEAVEFYGDVLRILDESNIPFLVGGGFAFSTYTRIFRDTKDLDIFVMPNHLGAVLDSLREAGYEVSNKFPHWLAKAYHGGRLIDIIFNSGNGACPVDREWFTHAKDGMLVGRKVKLMPAEEMIWQKAFIMERHRYDGADIIHLFHALRDSLDWDRLKMRFEDHWMVLLSHLLLYHFVFPTDHCRGAHQLTQYFTDRLQEYLFQEQSNSSPNGHALCRGTLLSLLEYLPAVQKWGYQDARELPHGNLTSEEIEHWTNTFER